MGPLKRGRPTRKQQKGIKSLIESYYGISKTYQEISTETGFNRKTIGKYLTPLYKAAIKKIDEEFLKEYNQRSKSEK